MAPRDGGPRGKFLQRMTVEGSLDGTEKGRATSIAARAVMLHPARFAMLAKPRF